MPKAIMMSKTYRRTPIENAAVVPALENNDLSSELIRILKHSQTRKRCTMRVPWHLQPGNSFFLLTSSFATKSLPYCRESSFYKILLIPTPSSLLCYKTPYSLMLQIMLVENQVFPERQRQDLRSSQKPAT